MKCMPARPTCEPRLDLRMAVGGTVVDDAVDVQLGGYGVVDLAQEGQEFLVSVARFAGSEHCAIEHVQRREPRGRSVALVVVGYALDIAESNGQHRLRALQSLALDFLVHADHQRVVGRAQVQADHVAQLLDEERVVGQPEAFGAMRLQADGRSARRWSWRCRSRPPPCAHASALRTDRDEWARGGVGLVNDASSGH